ncbi:MAG: response regulator [Candidatus Firestonebacteria bacterium]|nr:response regulator [Candidatus Firestonebacteria bacterium]
MKKTVLIIEDDVDIQTYYEVVLSNLEITLLKAGNGKEAFTIIDSGVNPDLIILDIIMPVMNGEEFLYELRKVRKLNIPVILSSVDEVSAKEITSKYKVKYVYYKLGSLDDLLCMIKKILF